MFINLRHVSFSSFSFSREFTGLINVLFFSALAPTHHPSKIITSGLFLIEYHNFFLFWVFFVVVLAFFDFEDVATFFGFAFIFDLSSGWHL